MRGVYMLVNAILKVYRDWREVVFMGRKNA